MESKEGVKLTWEVKYASHVDSYSSLVLGTEKLVEIKNNPQRRCKRFCVSAPAHPSERTFELDHRIRL